MHRAFKPLNEDTGGQLLALRFGPFELDVRSGELRRNGTTVRLQPQPFKVLLVLAGRPGEVVTREELQAEVWPAGTFVDFEQSLNFCVRQIRAALGDNANSPRYLETLPRRGYRWIGGPVERVAGSAAVREWPRAVAADPSAPVSAGLPPSPAVAPPGPAPRARPVWPLAVAIAVAVIGAIAAREWLRPAREPPGPPVFQRMTFRRGSVHAARFGPDGQVVYTAAWDGEPRFVHVARSEPRDFRALDVQGLVVGVSRSGEVAFIRDGVLARAPLAGGPPKEVLKPVVAADWTADGADFAVARKTSGGFRIEFPVGHVLEETPVRPSRLRLSPDGRDLAIAYHPTLDDDRGLVVVLDAGGRRIAATPEWASLDGLAWAPGGREVWFTASEVGADNSLWALSLDGRVRPVLSGMGRLVLHDAAPDGSVLLERATLRCQVLFRRAGDAEDRDLSWLDYSAVVGISPDGSTVLFYESGQGGGPGYATFLRRTDGSPPVRVGSGRALGLSPDGAWVLSVSLGNPDHLDLTPTGPGENRTIRLPGVVAHEQAGFVDGSRIFVTGRDATGRRATWLTDLDAKAPRRLPLPEGRILSQNTFSADGTRFVASCPASDHPCFYDTASGRAVPVRGAQDGWITVGFDSRGRLYFHDDPKGGAPKRLFRLDLASGVASPVAELAPRDRAGLLRVLNVHVAASGEAWTYSVIRRLSDLHVVTGLR